MISVIIPAYKAQDYILHCISSIHGKTEYEILIGVDDCKQTYDMIKDHPMVDVFYFTKNVGPYVIKNTLSDIAKYDKLLFFDADDVLAERCLDDVDDVLNVAEYIKLPYINFTNKINKTGHSMSDAVIAIKKRTFNSLNGFYPWKCAADTEFAKRLEHNKCVGKTLNRVAYYRRLHGNNLTLRKETTHGSAIRNSYRDIISANERAKYWPNPQIKIIQPYVKNPNAC